MLRSAYDNSTTVYSTSDYGSLSSCLPIVDRVPQTHGEKAPIDDRPGDDGYFPGRPFQVYLSYLLPKPILFTRNVVAENESIALA